MVCVRTGLLVYAGSAVTGDLCQDTICQCMLVAQQVLVCMPGLVCQCKLVVQQMLVRIRNSLSVCLE